MLDKLKEAGGILRSDPWHFLSLILTIWLPARLLAVLAMYSSAPEPEYLSLQAEALQKLFAPVYTGALLYSFALRRNGATPSYREALRFGFRIWPRLLVAQFVAGVIIALGTIALILPGVVLFVALSLVESVVVVEGAGVSASIRRSSFLTKGMRWRLFGVMIRFFSFFLVLVILLALLAGDNVYLLGLSDGILTLGLALLSVILFLIFAEVVERGSAHDFAEIHVVPAHRPTSAKEKLAYVPLIALIVALSLIPTARSVAFDWNDVPTRAMSPTVIAGDRVYINKSAYGLRSPLTGRVLVERADPGRSDLIVFASPEDGQRLLKRIVAMPGEVFEVRSGRVYVNHEPAVYEAPDEEVLSEVAFANANFIVTTEVIDGHRHPVLLDSTAANASFGPVQIPAEHYFVLGDYRSNSRDSRWFGPIHRSAIYGRVDAVVLSLDPERLGRPRWHRFFSSLR